MTDLPLGRKLVENVLLPLKQVFVGKDEIIDLLGVALAGGENLFLLGPPGTAKSAIVRELGKRLEGRVFDYLLTRFTEPNELFGPFDIRKLREGELVTNTEGMLPEADLVFLDELLNANSAILNSLLMALNERVFRRGRETKRLPSLLMIGASNRLPEDETLGALFDRFLLRVRCDNVPAERLNEVLAAGWELDLSRDREPESRISVDELRLLQKQLGTIDLLPIRAAYSELVLRLRNAGIMISDRRAVKLQRLVAASALLCGRSTATTTDFWVLRYIWDTEDQIEVIASLVQAAMEHATEEEKKSAHPRSLGQIPNPEELARELQVLIEKLREPSLSAEEQVVLRDRLSLLAARIPWVADGQQRDFLKRELDTAWNATGPQP